MSGKLPIWEYLEVEETIIEDKTAKKIVKKNKTTENKSKLNESLWLKSLLKPSHEHELLKFEVTSVISCTETKLVCKIDSKSLIGLEFSNLIGYFDIWWWKDALSRSEFIVLEEILKRHPFLNRISKSENLVGEGKEFYLLLNTPVVLADENDPKTGIVACKRFLIIE